MIAKSLIPLIAATLFSLNAHAHDCSGGANGGMDATGNQCNDVVTAAMGHAAGNGPVAAPPESVEPAKVASRSNGPAKRSAGTRHTSARSQVKHG